MDTVTYTAQLTAFLRHFSLSTTIRNEDASQIIVRYGKP